MDTPAAAPFLTSRLQGFGTTIFAEMTGLANAHGAVNLGQGFPDFDGPASVLEAAVQAMRDGHNQYAPGRGVPVLRTAITAHQRDRYGLSWDPDTEVLVTAGATEAICATLLALCEPGDEVVAFEPFYDSYAASVAMAGATLVGVTLELDADSGRFGFDADALRTAITPRTRLLLLNSPHNPTGKVFTREELALVRDLAVEHDLLVMTDEVYEHLVFDVDHVPLATLDGMRERTLTISSAGKTFSFTGWKIGWITARPELIDAVVTAKQFMTFVNGTPFQYAIAQALGLGDPFFATFRAEYRARRDRLVAGLRDVGLRVAEPEGTYFATADVRALGLDDGLELCRALPAVAGVAAIPTQVFYADPARGRHLVRFAFCKTDAVLDEGVRRLRGAADDLAERVRAHGSDAP